MGKIEIISENISSRISEKLSLNSDEKEVIAYGSFIFIQTALSVLMIAILGAVLGVLAESMIISFTAAALRKFSGGAHAKTPIDCALIGMIVFAALAYFVKHILISMEFIYLVTIMLVGFAFVVYIITRYSPVGSVNKPLRKETTRKRLKAQSLKLVSYLFIACIVLLVIYTQTDRMFFLSSAVCLATGVVWQSITLVSLGHYIIDKLERVLRDTKKIIRRTSE